MQKQDEFAGMGLDARLLKAVTDLGFTRPTPVQTTAIPAGLAGRDVLGCAETGSGKTAAFMLPILQRLAGQPRGTTRALVVVPTRELAMQVEEHTRELAAHTDMSVKSIYGGVSMGPQVAAFKRGVDIMVATPGRLLDHMGRAHGRLDSIEMLVLDEADRMLDMGFLPDIRRIMGRLGGGERGRRQTFFFSATMPSEIVKLSGEMLRDPARIEVERKQAPAAGVLQALYEVEQKEKTGLLLELLRRNEVGNAIVFTRTKHRANRLAQKLEKQGVSVSRIHGNRSQNQRTKALEGFKAGRFRVIVATDILARGIDVEALDHVINYDAPATPEDYIHRVGRTGRAERTGDAYTFVTPEDRSLVRAIERKVGQSIERRTLADYDYSPSGESLEIPLDERLAKMRAERAEGRRRAAEKNARSGNGGGNGNGGNGGRNGNGGNGRGGNGRGRNSRSRHSRGGNGGGNSLG